MEVLLIGNQTKVVGLPSGNWMFRNCNSLAFNYNELTQESFNVSFAGNTNQDEGTRKDYVLIKSGQSDKITVTYTKHESKNHAIKFNSIMKNTMRPKTANTQALSF